MSGIVGIYRNDGRPADRSLLARMLEDLAHRGADRHGIWTQGSIGFGHRLLFTTAESLREHQPIIQGEELALVWDGRLDNRADLIGALVAEGLDLGDKTDPELTLAAYRYWGKACPEKLIGDFAFALWDERSRRLFCARDRLGLRPFHYRREGPAFFFASEIPPLLRSSDTTPEPDDEMIVAFLLREFRDRDQERTFVQSIRRLLPGHTLCVEGGAVQVQRYWTVDPSRLIRYADDRDYVEHFRHLFQEAVRCRLRSYFPLGLLLSGGLDSSSIACTAHALDVSGGETWPAIHALNRYGVDPGTDERLYVKDVVDATGMKAHALPTSDPTNPLSELISATKKLHTPILDIGSPSEDDLLEAARLHGCRALLSGDGADQLLSEIGYLADLLATGRLWRFAQETTAMADWYGGDRAEFREMATMLVVPERIKYWGKRVLRGMPPPWMNSGLARSIRLKARVQEPRCRLPFPSFCQTDTYHAVTNPYYVLKLEVDERLATAAGMEFRYPFLDSRLVEFMLAIPWRRRTKEGMWKWILRESMRGVLPESVRLRRTKGYWGDRSARVVTSLCDRDQPVPLENISGRMWRYLNEEGVRKLIKAYLRGAQQHGYDLWFLISVDYWLAAHWGKE